MLSDPVKSAVTKYWLTLGIVIAVIVGVLFPGGVHGILKYYLIDIGVVLVMFLGSLKLSTGQFLSTLKQWRLLGFSVVGVFVLSPIIALSMSHGLGFKTESEQIAVLIAFAQGSTLASGIVLTEIAKGDVALAIVISVLNNVLTVIMAPLIFVAALGVSIQVEYVDMVGEMALKLIVPVLLGQMVRRKIGKIVFYWSKRFSVASQLIVMMFIYTGVASVKTQVSGSGERLFLVFCLAVGVHLVMLIINTFFGKWASKSSQARVAFILCSSQKALPTAMLIWKSYFPMLPLGPFIAVVHHMTQLVIDSLIAPRFLRLPLVKENTTLVQRSKR